MTTPTEHEIFSGASSDASDSTFLPETLPAEAERSFAEARVCRPILAADLAGHMEPARPRWIQELEPIDEQATWSADVSAASREQTWSVSDALTHRQSRRPSGTPTVAAVTALLSRLCDIRRVGVDAAGREWSSRAVPSAGGTHAIDVLVHVPVVGPLQGPAGSSSHPSQWYRWVPAGQAANGSVGRLEQIGLDGDTDSKVSAALADSHGGRVPPLSVVAVADTVRLFRRYPLGTSLLWRDAGAFLMTTHLLATELGLASTLLGCGGQVVGGSRDWPVIVVGAVAVGSSGL